MFSFLYYYIAYWNLQKKTVNRLHDKTAIKMINISFHAFSPVMENNNRVEKTTKRFTFCQAAGNAFWMTGG